ncbi:MAG: adenylosuccinate lyase [Planctomycetes bacterium]|jgi:adenylosuccinate lyase|nr:adenylosuccinate lyase [Planctomycetota bacterium]MDP6408188.1 adenylosuccinate lyase [Planctomycetota bacterium]
MSDADTWSSPLAGRYASRAMRELLSPRTRFATWRRLWLALAECEAELGLPISEAQLDELRATLGELNLEVAEEHERRLRHDVMAHVHAWGEQCPTARAILHLGATSCFVTDNADLWILREGVRLLRRQLVSVIAQLRDFAWRWRSLPTLGFTHYQPAQATTVGKRACLWLQDLVHDLADLDHAEEQIRFRGVKGTTGTQASFLELFEGDHDKVLELDRRVTERMGFERCFGVTGQTYPRQLDFRIGQALSSLAQSAHKFATDLRLLSNSRELEEPFETDQIGSSAMPWKRNPMRSERMCSLARLVMVQLDNTAHTAANQWLERTLDDSANRRVVLSELFLATDAVFGLYLNVSANLVVHPELVRRNLERELPFLASEALMMEAVKAGCDRQDVHEAVRRASFEAARSITQGGENDLRARLAETPILSPVADRIDDLLDPARFVGRAPEQVAEFLAAEVDPLLEVHAALLGAEGEVRV